MMRLALVFLAAPALSFALCPSHLQVEVTDSSLRVQLQTDVTGGSTAIRLHYGASPKLERSSVLRAAVDNNARWRYLNVTDLQPGLAKLYFDPQVSDPSLTAWSDYGSCQAQLCPTEGEQRGGYACEADGRGSLIPFVRVPEAHEAIELPAPPKHARENPRERPEINGSITKLTNCSAVQQVLDDHGAGGTKDPNLNHEIRLPAGAICRPEQEDSKAGKNLALYTLPPKRGAGTTIITCDWDPQEGPPAG
ncbi:MAG: hypothetical protein KDC27_10980, partial [Acidobacteria bacterium]|nr:hypothetical protein [Acidobacteriota bacterium]